MAYLSSNSALRRLERFDLCSYPSAAIEAPTPCKETASSFSYPAVVCAACAIVSLMTSQPGSLKLKSSTLNIDLFATASTVESHIDESHTKDKSHINDVQAAYQLFM